MKRNTTWSGLWACLGIFLLILDGKTALEGARTGVELCLGTVIPALFPFIVLSTMLTGTSFPFLRPLGKLCKLPDGAESLLIPAFLGGYPVGAQSVAAAYRAGQLDRNTAQRMLAFCNNAGPSFLFGMAASLFPASWMAWALWGIHLVSALLTARLIPADTGREVHLAHRQKPGISDALQAALRLMALICGWVVLFRVVIAFLQRWCFFFLSTEAQITVTGLLELTNGCCELPKISDLPFRFTLCSVMLALGGLCVTMQTASVTKGLSLKFYFLGKTLQCVFSLLLCGCLFYGRYFVICVPLSYLALVLVEKKSRIPAPAIV